MGRGEQGLRERERERERGRRRVCQVRTCALAICPARSACPIVRRRRRERSERTSPNADYSNLSERSAWKENFTRVDKFLLTWQVSRVSDEGVAVRKGGARLGQRSARAPTIFSSADVAALRVEPCSGEAAACLFLPPLRRTIDPGDDPGVYGAAICMFCPAVLPAMSIASSCSRAAVKRAYRQKGP